MTKAASVTGRNITTLEGLGSPEAPSKVQAAFIAEAAAQCGYCTSGMIMTATALLNRNPKPKEADIRAALGRQSVPLRQPCAGDCGVLRAAKGG
jgi:nicotinate dehydrogenase subunit A